MYQGFRNVSHLERFFSLFFVCSFLNFLHEYLNDKIWKTFNFDDEKFQIAVKIIYIQFTQTN